MSASDALLPKKQQSALQFVDNSFYIPIISDILWLSSSSHSMKPARFDIKVAGMEQRYFVSPTTGLLLFHRTWQAVAPQRGIVYLVHGYGEHCGRYEAVATILTAQGFTVHSMDHQGHGASEGDRAYYASFSHLVLDVLHMVQTIKPAPAGVPRFLMGHSMGALCALHVAHAAAPGTFDGLIVSGPGLVFDPKVDTPFNRFMARMLSGCMPKLGVTDLRLETLCSDPAVVAQYARDPLNYHGKLRVRVGYEMMGAVAEVKTWVGTITLPILIAHGEDDELCGIAGSRWLVDAVGSKDKTFTSYPGLRHEIFHEKPGPSIVQSIAAWMLKRMPAAPAAAVPLDAVVFRSPAASANGSGLQGPAAAVAASDAAFTGSAEAKDVTPLVA